MNYDFNSKKYIFMLIVVCLLFLILIIKAFDYLPNSINEDATIEQPNIAVNTLQPESNNNEENKQTVNEEKPDRHKSGHIDFYINDNVDINDIDEIPAPKGVFTDISDNSPDDSKKVIPQNLPKEEAAIRCYIKAKKLQRSSDFSNSLQEYLKIKDLTDDEEINAMAYEGIAEIYAKNKKYGTALSFAKKSNTLSPSNSREMLIAKIYYSAGKNEGAVKLLNNMLKRSF